MNDHSLAQHGRLKMDVARLSVISNSVLTLSKLGVGLAIGSIAVVAEALHSGLDLVAAIIALWSVRKASQPADDVHPFGHGKFESVSAIIEGLLIFIAAAGIIYPAVHRLVRGGAEVSLPLAGVAIMGVSAAVNVAVSRRLFRVARQTESPALEADAWHLRTDVYTSLGVLVGMTGIWISEKVGFHGGRLIDPIAALIVAVTIARAAWDISWRSLAQLTDNILPADEIKLVQGLIIEHYPQFVNYHRLRSRRAGSERHIDLHLVMPPETPVAQAHEFCDHLEQDIRDALPNVHLLIHVEPAGHEE